MDEQTRVIQLDWFWQEQMVNVTVARENDVINEKRKKVVNET